MTLQRDNIVMTKKARRDMLVGRLHPLKIPSTSERLPLHEEQLEEVRFSATQLLQTWKWQ